MIERRHQPAGLSQPLSPCPSPTGSGATSALLLWPGSCPSRKLIHSRGTTNITSGKGRLLTRSTPSSPRFWQMLCELIILPLPAPCPWPGTPIFLSPHRDKCFLPQIFKPASSATPCSLKSTLNQCLPRWACGMLPHPSLPLSSLSGHSLRVP